jgi:hypothetical protein
MKGHTAILVLIKEGIQKIKIHITPISWCPSSEATDLIQS